MVVIWQKGAVLKFGAPKRCHWSPRLLTLSSSYPSIYFNHLPNVRRRKER